MGTSLVTAANRPSRTDDGSPAGRKEEPIPQRPNLITKRHRADGILLTKRPRDRHAERPSAISAKLKDFADWTVWQSPPPAAALMIVSQLIR
jgi:hypothetical protein